LVLAGDDLMGRLMMAGRSIRRAAQLGLTCLVVGVLLGVVGLVLHVGWLVVLARSIGGLATLLLFVSGVAWLATGFLGRHGAEDDSPKHD